MDINLNEKIFNYSQQKIKSQRRTRLAVILMMDLVLAAFVFVFMISRGHVFNTASIVSLLAVVGVVSLVAILVSKKILMSLTDIKIRVTPDYIERFTPNSSEKISFKDLKSLAIVKSTGEKVNYIDLATEKSVLGIYGFENMEEISEILKTRANANTQVTERRPLINWEDPKVIVAYVAILMLVMFFGFGFWRKLNYVWRNALIGSFWLFYGLWFIKFGMASKYSGRKFRRLEVILGSLMIILGIFSIIFAGRR